MNTIQIPELVPATSQLAPTPTDDPYADSERSFEIVDGKVVEKNMGLIENLIASLLYERLAP